MNYSMTKSGFNRIFQIFNTQRESMNHSQINIASILPMGKSYDAEYNQRSLRNH